MTTSSGGGTAELVAELRAQAEAARARAVETKVQVAREVVEVLEQAKAVSDALATGARESAEHATAESRRTDEALIADARAEAASTIAAAEAKAAGIRVTAAESGDESSAALARAEVRRESAAVQADALRLTARREAGIHRRQLLEETHDAAHSSLDSVSDMIARLGVTLEDMGQTLTEIPPSTARLRAELAAPDQTGVSDPSPDATGAARSRGRGNRRFDGHSPRRARPAAPGS